MSDVERSRHATMKAFTRECFGAGVASNMRSNRIPHNFNRAVVSAKTVQRYPVLTSRAMTAILSEWDGGRDIPGKGISSAVASR